jgi:phosphate-selective porin OprO/OprP
MTSMKPHLAMIGLLLAPATTLAATPPDFEIGGQVQVDIGFFDGAHNEHMKGSESGVRRARLGFKHESKKGWEGEFEIDIDDDQNEVSITDAYVRYTDWSFGEITFGKMKEPFGLENTTGSKSINTIERSVVTEAFKPGRNHGLLFSRFHDSYTFEAGAFRAAEDEQGLDSYAMTGRLVLHPINTENRLVHLGFSGSERDMEGSEHRINEPLEIDAAASIIEGRRIQADKISQFSLEGAVVFGPFSLQAEWMEQGIDEVADDSGASLSTTYSGHYVLASYFLTGESRPYKKGSFGGVKPNRDSGAWELVVRRSSIDLDDMADTVKADTITVGINYYATGRVKFMLAAAKSDVEGPDPLESGDAESLQFRAQYEF